MIRLFFQYLITFVLMVLVATGLSGLLTQLLSRSTTLLISSGTLARNFSFTVVGIPLLIVMWRWLRKSFDEDRFNPVWTLYITAISLTSLLIAVTSINDLAASLLRGSGSEFNRSAIAQFLVWGVVWAFHWRIDQRTPQGHRSLHLLLGSLVGLVVSAIGLVTLLGGLANRLFSSSDFLINNYSPVRNGLALLVAGMPVWLWYWLRNAYVREREDSWNTYVLLAGVAGGLITTVASASVALYKILVWFLGDPTPAQASRFFVNTPMTAAAALVGLLIWWYHQAVLSENAVDRTEVRRVYEYLIAGISVVAIGVGLSIVVVAAIESLTRSQEILTPSPVNTLLLAFTLLLVSLPVWYLFWRQISGAVASQPAIEHSSPTRRVYLFLLFGIGGIVAIGALIATVYMLFQGIFDSRLGVGTFRRMRVPLGMLISTAAISSFHWRVFRSDAPHRQERTGLRYVLLIGPKDQELESAIRREFGARIEARPTVGLVWSHEQALDLLRSTHESAVVLTAGREELIVLRG